MNAARRVARAGRNLLIALVVGAVIIVAIVIAYMAGRGNEAPSARPSVGSTRPLDVGSGAAEDVAPTGCLGGTAIGNAMLLRAQATAPRTTYGAVEVATAFFRWGYRFPAPSASDVIAVQQLFPSEVRATALRGLQTSFAANANPASGVVPDGTEFQISTTNGAWTAEPASGADAANVSVQAAMNVGGEVSPTKTSAEAFVMIWEDGKWRVSRFGRADAARLNAGGTAFSAGC